MAKKKQKTTNLNTQSDSITNIEINGDVSNSNVIGETKEISKVEIPVEELIAYIVAKIDYLTDVVESRIPKKESLKL